MKKYISLFILGLFAFSSATAQIDRSKQPQPGPAPTVNLSEPRTFTMENGMTVLIVEDNKLPSVRFQLLIDNPIHASGDKTGVESLFSAMMGNGTTTISKDDFNEEIDYMGVSIFFGNESAYAQGLSDFTQRIIELMSDAIINPLFTQEEFEKEKAKLIESLRLSERDVPAIARRVQDALVYGSRHPKGEFTTIEKVEKLTLNDVKQYYNNFYNPNNAYLVIVGDVDYTRVRYLISENFTNWEKKNLPSVSYSDPQDVQYTQINFIDMPNAVQSEIAVMNLVDLKMSHPDYFPVLVANRILGGDFNSFLNMNLREKHGWTYGARSSIPADKYVSSFSAVTQVRNAVTDSAVVEILKEIRNIREKKVTPAELNRVKAKYTGDFVLALERPETVANYALRIKTQNLSNDFYENFLRKINAVTAEDVMRVAKKYFKEDNLRIVIVGKGSEVLDGLKSLKNINGRPIPVMYFDRFANSTSEPVFNQAIESGVTAKTVLDKYIDVIGGRKAVEGVKTMEMEAVAEVQGMQLSMKTVNTAKRQSLMTLSMGEMVIQKEVFDGEKGYQMAQGVRTDLGEEEIKDAKANAHPFKELFPENATLVRSEDVDGKPAYVITFGDGKTENYYDKESGLLIQAVTSFEMMGQNLQSIITFDDYKTIDGIKIPFKMEQSVGPQTLKITVQNIELNNAVSDDLFK